MRNLLMLAALAPLSAATAQSLPATIVPPHCKPGADKVVQRAPRVGPQRLGDLPPANQYKMVWRTDQRGCPQPVVVRRDIGPKQGRTAKP